MSSIPASTLVAVNPSVIDAGSSLLSLTGLFLTDSAYAPTNTVLSFAKASEVAAYFGSASVEAAAASTYFKGNTGSTSKPSTVYFAAYVPLSIGLVPPIGGGDPLPPAEDGVSAFLRGASLKGTTLAQLQAMSGDFSIDVDGATLADDPIDFSAATSFDDAASILSAALGDIPVEFDADLFCFFVRSETTGDTSTITAATGTLAQLLRMTTAFPITVSQGSNGAALPETMDQIVGLTQKFSTFTTIFEPDADGKDALAGWVNGQNSGYAYIAWDTDSNALIGAADCLGLRLRSSELSGTSPIYAPTETDGLALAAFVMGTAASIDFAQTNGRITFAYKGQVGLVPTVTDAGDATTLKANGYNFYGSYATKSAEFQLFQTGMIAGEWKWLDTFLNQIYMNSRIQQVLMQLLASVNSIPYNTDGYNMLRATISKPAAEFLSFGSIRAGIPLDTEQASIVNQQAGVGIDDVLSTTGWYLQILPATSQARSARTTPPMKFWYTDGGSIHGIVLDSINVL